jgi:hypothetical protein
MVMAYDRHITLSVLTPEKAELEKGHLTCLWCGTSAILSFELPPRNIIIYNIKR